MFPRAAWVTGFFVVVFSFIYYLRQPVFGFWPFFGLQKHNVFLIKLSTHPCKEEWQNQMRWTSSVSLMAILPAPGICIHDYFLGKPGPHQL